MAERTKSMTQGAPVRLIVTFALPLMVGNVFQQLYTVVDTAVVGRGVGVGALAALGAADWLNWMVLSIVQGITQGFSILMAQYFGAKDERELSRTAGAAVTLTGLFALLILVVSQAAAYPVMCLLNTPEDIMGDAMLYLRIVFAGIPVIAAYNLLAAMLRALGDSKTPLYAMVAACLINVGLDLLFVMGLHWGVAGAAGATVIAQVFSGVYCLRAVRRVRILKIEKRDLLPGRKLAFHLLGLGTPVATQNGIISVGGMVVQTVINRYGMLFIAGFTATNKLYGLLEIAATSYGYAVTSYVGQNLGAGQVGRIRQGMRAATWVALGTSVVIAGSMAAFGGAFLRLFIGQEQAGANQSLEIAYHYLLVMSVCLPILYMLHIYRSALMGLGDTVVPMVSGFAEMVMRVGVALLLPLVLGQEGIFYAEVAAWTGAAVILVSAYFIRMRGRRDGPPQVRPK